MPPLSHAAVVSNNATELGLEVVCSWPVSGQYGPGTRVLYYVLIAACVFARKEEWVRNACLAGALLFPAIAALHGIVLAAVHVDAMLDRDPHRAPNRENVGHILQRSASAHSFPVDRSHSSWAKPSKCTHDDNGNPVLSDPARFPYEAASCGLRCSAQEGPFSPIRVGSADEIYVIPSPHRLTFGTATLLAAACCVPAVVSLLYFWSLVLRDTWNNRFGESTDTDRRNEVIEGTNGATEGKMLQINSLVRTVLSTVEAPVFAAAVLAILVLGERNFFSHPVNFGTEPIASIGQWAPIVGTGFAIFGSLYLFLTDDGEKPSSACKCTCHNAQGPSSRGTDPAASTNSSELAHCEITVVASPEPAHTHPTQEEARDFGYRRSIGRALKRLADTISIAAHDRLTDYDFKQGPALDFPEIPAEEQRNSELPQIRDQYNLKRDSTASRTLSRVGSTVSTASWRDGERSSTTSHGISPRSSRQSTRSRSPSPLPSPSRRDDESCTFPGSHDGSPSSSDPPILNTRRRQNTLEVPPHHGPVRRSSSISSASSSNFTMAGNLQSPTIVVSADDDVSPVFPRPGSPEPKQEVPPHASRHGRRFTS
ncbi:hypothetical protein AN5303.2 [Aspergillus nidulans FGSC A4]|uniref:Uncharacterized protein n=1 Tax=Emericella nidulans (strain FGSC A4 / ATCC 38163 / CBS 112.46 / NRRL 194 / M139) TaxID=227321 RepID=Q5B2C7_EMENI|nr:hypothetical protein [Aspergillus nidulans FGSC A4]EAA62463.1 hypothetical protein AN5303.2 [Aspergillus nidulans FGSC A4]CBF82136.1 TPA: conserved hypothetical protein [Aspergillus nidulans FGSC A4]|eukprot:XP_662907.1 hypothetical protein AN5303.2 [Aspergillus nidulans FGSC A4]